MQLRALPKLVLQLLAGLTILTVSIAGVSYGPLLFETNHYADVRSIETDPHYRDKALMARAWALPVARLYRARGFVSQSNQSFCGPASIANVLASLGKPMAQQAVVDGTAYEPWFGMLIGGLTLDQMADLLRQRTARPVERLRNLPLADFRAHLRASNDPARRYVVNFHRGPLFGRGHGHHSPILGYLPEQDLVLLGDVNGDYRPYLVSAERLWKGVNTVDSETGDLRGLAMVRVQ